MIAVALLAAVLVLLVGATLWREPADKGGDELGAYQRIPNLCFCADCDAVTPMTTHGECLWCKSRAVVRREVFGKWRNSALRLRLVRRAA